MKETIESLEKKREDLYKSLLEISDFRRGIISVLYRKCGKKCLCQRGESWTWTAAFMEYHDQRKELTKYASLQLFDLLFRKRCMLKSKSKHLYNLNELGSKSVRNILDAPGRYNLAHHLKQQVSRHPLPQNQHTCGFHDFGARLAKSRSTVPTA